MSMRKYGASSFKRPMTEEKEMSEFKQFYFNVFSKEVCEDKEPDIGSEDSRRFVMAEDYASLKAERDALAAENSRMKLAIKNIFPLGVEDEHGKAGFTDTAKECYLSSTETPATDAYTNQLRAEGVEMFAAHLRTDKTETSVCKMIALGADEFAANQRAGKDGE